MRVPSDQISRYGCAEIAESRGKLHRVSGLVEKPPAAEARSDLAVMGRYVLTPAIFPALRDTTPGALGEIQLTDAIGRCSRPARSGAWSSKASSSTSERRPAGSRPTCASHAEHPEFQSAVAGIDGTGARVNALRREWGAVTFVVTILVGAARRGDLAGSVRGSRHPHPVSCRPARRTPHTWSRRRRCPTATPKPTASGKATPTATPTPTAVPTPRSRPQPRSTRAAGLPDSATRHRSPSPTPTPKTTPTAVGATPTATPTPDSDAGPDHPAELDAAPDRDPDPDTARPAERSRLQRAKSSLLPFSGVIDERCSSMSTDGGCPVSITTAMLLREAQPTDADAVAKEGEGHRAHEVPDVAANRLCGLRGLEQRLHRRACSGPERRARRPGR